jgi:D-serine deaminase-like pyridoxal phosphate-dependent protein
MVQPARVGDTVDQIETPALVVDRALFEQNLDRMAAATSHIRLRPHAKTHRCPAVALQQIARGAVGVSCQTVGEAEAMVAGGVRDVLITNEVVSAAKLRRLVDLTAAAQVGVLVDHPAALADLARTASALPEERAIDVLVEIEVGQGRCGVSDPSDIVALARAAAAAPGLSFNGLQAYHGSAQHGRTPDARQTAIAGAAVRVRSALAALTAAGLTARIIGGAGTGTLLLEARSGLWNELQPGSYVFMDRDYRANTLAPGDPVFAQALHLYATVISAAAPGRAVLDVGLKTVAVDSGPPDVDQPGWQTVRVSDEHTTCTVPAGVTPGTRVRVVPGHIDPTVNLHDWIVVVDSGVVVDLWAITGRGSSA